MLDINTAVDLMKKYGYTSTTVPPYIYKNGDTIGICYTFVDDKFGLLERVAIFRSSQEMDDFLKKYQWFKKNGKDNNVTMFLDDYSSPSPNIIYYRNGHIMASDEMFNLEKYDDLEIQKKELNEIDRYILEASELISYYNEFKEKKLEFYNNLKILKSDKRKKYYELQLLVDKYNNGVFDRKILDEDVDTSNEGININMERAIKERLSQYKGSLPSKKEAIDFIFEVWNLCKNLELNTIFYKRVIEEDYVKAEIDLANKKKEFMDELLKTNKSFIFKKNLVKSFKKIDDEFYINRKLLGDDFVDKCLSNVELKYSSFDKLDVLKVSEYLKESLINNNYDELISKYAIVTEVVEKKILYDQNKIIGDIKNKFNTLTPIEQNSLILYFSSFKELFNIILEIPNYNNIEISEVVKQLNLSNNFTALSKTCYENCKIALSLDTNKDYQKSIFANYDFSTLETFIKSCIETINILVKIDKLVLNGDLDVYLIKDNEFKDIISTYENIGIINGKIKNSELLPIIAKINYGTKILFTDRVIDFGDKSNTAKYSIKEIKEENIALIKKVSNITEMTDKLVVSKYSSVTTPFNNIKIVDKLNLNSKHEYVKVNINNNEEDFS